MSSLENIDLLQTRILICGLGSIGRRHARVFNQLSPDIQLSALRSGHGSQCTESELMTIVFYIECIGCMESTWCCNCQSAHFPRTGFIL